MLQLLLMMHLMVIINQVHLFNMLVVPKIKLSEIFLIQTQKIAANELNVCLWAIQVVLVNFEYKQLTKTYNHIYIAYLHFTFYSQLKQVKFTLMMRMYITTKNGSKMMKTINESYSFYSKLKLSERSCHNYIQVNCSKQFSILLKTTSSFIQ